MKSWSNIQISPRDPEIIKINELEKDLEKDINGLSELIDKISEKKYQQYA